MLYSGISWDKAGFEVEVVDADGRTVAPAVRFPARRAAEIVGHLNGFGEPVVAVVDSTNGVLDGGLTVAGIEVHRADPQLLPDRPPFGSVPAGVLARVAQRDLDRLPRLDLADGTLRGRGDDLNAGFAASADTVTELTAAGRCLTHGRRDRDEIALTFDDGPLPPYTGQILDILDSYQVKATFFCVGLLVDAYPEIVDEIRRRGHELGNHTWSHPFLPELSRAESDEQVQRTGEALAAATGTAPPTLFRPPYGGRSPQALTGLAETGMTTVLWDALGWDWALPGVDRIVESVSTGTGPGSVVLLHDGGGDRSQTVAALPKILDGLLDRGLRFVTVDHLLATSHPTQARPATSQPVEAR